VDSISETPLSLGTGKSCRESEWRETVVQLADGRDLVQKKAEERWGAGVVEQVSLDLRREFPDEDGFSARNLRYMKQWYQYYTPEAAKLQRPVAEIMAVYGIEVNLQKMQKESLLFFSFPSVSVTPPKEKLRKKFRVLYLELGEFL